MYAGIKRLVILVSHCYLRGDSISGISLIRNIADITPDKILGYCMVGGRCLDGRIAL